MPPSQLFLNKIIKLDIIDCSTYLKITLFMFCAIWLFGSFFTGIPFQGIVPFILYTIYSLVAAFIFAVPASLINLFVFDSIFIALGGAPHKAIPLREQLRADLEKAKIFKRNQQYEEAEQLLNSILEKDPHFPEALFIQAHILWGGFDNAGGAKGCLRKLMKTTPEDEKYHRWAKSLMEEICEKQREEVVNS